MYFSGGNVCAVEAPCVMFSLQVRSDTRQVRLQEAGRLRFEDQPGEQDRQSRTTGARVVLTDDNNRDTRLFCMPETN